MATNFYEGMTLPKYLTQGFTITMWVRFLDKVNSGTLFNFGSPLRNSDPHGFRLETFVVNKDEKSAPVGSDGENFYGNENAERFIRLVVREGDGTIRDSQVGKDWRSRSDTKATGEIPQIDNEYSDGLFTYTRVPIDFNEWYFIVASYDPLGVSENASHDIDLQGIDDSDFWMGNVLGDGTYTPKSGLGNRCKVEIISKSDLVMARGFKISQESS
tara:strand:+ start:8941 stop:9585 length:645 start_codon:yes stop_codon:yes gene_type:complete